MRRVTLENRCIGFFGREVSRARYYQPGSGRFWGMDSFEGKDEDPASLHK
jgi:hypothetical protein